MERSWTTGPVTRSKSRREPEPEPDHLSSSDSEPESDHETPACLTNLGPPRLQQPDVYVNANLMKVKMEVDYNPIIRVKQEVKVKVEKDNGDSDHSNDSKDSDDDIDGDTKSETAFNHEQLLTHKTYVNLTYTPFVDFIRESRAGGKDGGSEDALCEAAINWLKNQSRERSLRVKQLLAEFPDKKHKGRILQALFNLPDSEHKLQKMAFNLIMQLYMEETNNDSSSTNITQESCETQTDIEPGNDKIADADSTSCSTEAKVVDENQGPAKRIRIDRPEQEEDTDPEKVASATTLSPMESALQNFELLFKIFENLEDESLLFCRLVNQSWCKASSKFLQSRSTLVVKLERDPTGRLFFSNWRCSDKTLERLEKMKRFRLALFNEYFKQSQEFCHTFPSVNFMICGDTVENYHDLEHFGALSNQSGPESSCGSRSGLIIKRLHIEGLKLCWSTINTLETILYEKTPFLQTLSLGNYFFLNKQPAQSGSSQDQYTSAGPTSVFTKKALPSLKVLQVHFPYSYGFAGTSTMEVLTKILQASPNLERIEHCNSINFDGDPYIISHPDHLQLLVDTHKLHLVKRCSLELSAEVLQSELLNRNKLSGFRPTSLSLPNLYSFPGESKRAKNEVQFCLGEILWAVKDSVEELKIRCFSLEDDKLSQARFSKLRQLHYLSGKIVPPLFPPKVKGDDVFPVLEKLGISTGCYSSKAELRRAFKNVPVISSVRTLEIYPMNPITGPWINSLLLKYRNLPHLVLCGEKPYPNDVTPAYLHKMVPWNSIKQLKNLSVKRLYLKLEHHEAWFTGFSLETVQKLQDTAPEDWPKVEDVDDLRVYPSILQMTELEKLVIDLRWKYFKHQGPTLPLSFKYAFDLMPRLTVNIFV